MAEPRSHLRGHPIYWDGDRWRYVDTDTPTAEEDRSACGYCSLERTPEGHDGCIGTLPGVMNACCGHGEERMAYIQYPDGSVVQGASAVSEFERLRPTPQTEVRDGGE